MAKGRNRKLTSREPSGRPQREAAIVRRETDTPPARVRQILAAARTIVDRDGVLMGYEIGRLALSRRLTDGHVSAATSFATTYQIWCAVLGIPSPNARAQDISAIRGESGEIRPAVVDFVKSRMGNANSVLSSREYDILVNVAVRDHSTAGGALPVLISALDKISAAWGLTSAAENVRNAS